MRIPCVARALEEVGLAVAALETQLLEVLSV